MQKNKKILLGLLIILLLVVVTIGTTYAMYRSTTTGEGTIKIAKWSIKVDGTNIDQASYTFDADDVTWSANPGKNNTIAPGATGYIDIPVDATGSEVGVIITAELGSVTLPQGMTVTLASGSQTIPYSTDMSTNVRLNIAWSGATTDTTAKDTSDKSAQGTTITIPVTLTARQVLPE